MPPSPKIIITNAPVVPGVGRGRKLGFPTLNVDLCCVPKEMQEGIYGCRVRIGNETFAGALHYGPRPVFHDSVALEVHLIDAKPSTVPETIDLEIVGRIREVRNFESEEALKEEIRRDIAAVRAMLQA